MVLLDIETDLRIEFKMRLLPILRQDLNLHPRVDPHLLRLKTPHLGWEDEWMSFSVSDLFSDHFYFDQRQPRVKVLVGPTGSGRTSLGRHLLECWIKRDSKFPGIQQFKAIFMIDGEHLEKDEALTSILSILPDTASHWGIDALLDWIETAKILLIVNHFELGTNQEAKLVSTLNEWKGSNVLVLTSVEDESGLGKFLDSVNPALYCLFENLDLPSQPMIFQALEKENGKLKNEPFLQGKSFINIIKKMEPLFETIGGLSYYYQFFQMFPNKISHNTLTSFLWDSVYEKLNEVKVRYSLSEDNVEEWLLSMGMASYQCLMERKTLRGKELIPMLEKSKYLFPEIPNSHFLLEALLSFRYSLFKEEKSFCVYNHKQQEMFAAFYVLKKSLEGIPMKKLLNNLKADNLCIFIAGLLAKFMKGESAFKSFSTDLKSNENKVLRVMKNLSAQSEYSEDVITLISRILYEIEYRQDLMEMFLRDIVLPSHLYVHDIGILDKSIETLLAHSLPTKLHLLIRCGYKPLQILETIKLIKDQDLKLALAEMNHLKWGTGNLSDELIKTMFDGKGVKLQDFIGSLRDETIRQLHLHNATKNLVCLRVKVCDSPAAISLVQTQNLLPYLIWLEIDFDFSLDQVLQLQLSSIKTPLIDLSFSFVRDADLVKLCDFLYSLSSRFSGLHLHKCSLSPQGVTEMLKYFFRRGITLNADSKTILRYRKYRFPELASVDTKQDLTDDEIERLLGYDDRHHYSENEVRSSYPATYQEVHALKHFLAMMNLTYFLFCCPGYKVTKQTTGCCVVERSLISNIFQIA